MSATSPMARKNFDRSGEVQQWQATVLHDSQSNVSAALIAALYDSLMTFLRHVVNKARKQQAVPSYYQSLLDSIAALHFWGLDFRVSQGELDTSLQYSHHLRDTVLTVLASMGDLLCNGLVQIFTSKERQALFEASRISSLTEDTKAMLDEPLETYHYSGENIDGLFQTLQNMIDSLRVLKSSLDSVVDDESDDEPARQPMYLQERPAYQYYVDLIRGRFPLAGVQLAQELGKSDWDRYNYVSSLSERIQVGIEVIETTRPQSEFFDSGVGSSAPSDNRVTHEALLDCAATIVSSRAGVSHKRLPPLPDEGRSGNSFDCEICYRKVQMRRTKEWKKHIFEDICAYTCIFSGCTATRTLFKEREAMVDHLRLHHSVSEHSDPQECPLCLEHITGGLEVISLHFSRHMEEIALCVLPQPTESDNGSQVSDDQDENENQDTLIELAPQVPEEATEQQQTQEIFDKISGGLTSPTETGMITGKIIHETPRDHTTLPLLSPTLKEPEHESLPSTETQMNVASQQGTSDELNTVGELQTSSTNTRKASLSEGNGAASERKRDMFSKIVYAGPAYPKIKCPQCNERPDGFRGTHELERHIARAHSTTRKGYICIDASTDKRFLAKCKNCRNEKVYGAYYNAAAHLRRTHFHPRERGRHGKRSDEKRGGIGGGGDPPMDHLKKYWIKELDVPIPRQDPSSSQSLSRDPNISQPTHNAAYDDISLATEDNTYPYSFSSLKDQASPSGVFDFTLQDSLQQPNSMDNALAMPASMPEVPSVLETISTPEYINTTSDIPELATV